MSQIATTIEQSKRLVAAGLDPESADMWWTKIQPLKQYGYNLTKDGDPYVSLNLYRINHIALARYEEIPAWSLSRLIDIHRNFDYGPMDDGSAAVIDCLVRAICNEIKYETGRVREEFIVKRPLGQPQETEGA